MQCENRVPGRGGSVCECSAYSGGHAVFIIGWGGQDDGDGTTKFWLVRNSWGKNTGDGGIFKHQRGTNLAGFEERGAYALSAPVPPEDALVHTKCVTAVNGDLLSGGDAAKCYVKNTCEASVLAVVRPGAAVYDGKEATPNSCMYVDTEKHEYLVPPNGGYWEIKPTDDWFPLDRCYVHSETTVANPQAHSRLNKYLLKGKELSYATPTTTTDAEGSTKAALAAKKGAHARKVAALKKHRADCVAGKIECDKVPCECPEIKINGKSWKKVSRATRGDRPVWANGNGKEKQFLFFGDSTWYRGYKIASPGIIPGKYDGYTFYESWEAPSDSNMMWCPYDDGVSDDEGPVTCSDPSVEFKQLGDYQDEQPPEAEEKPKPKPKPKPEPEPEPKPKPEPEPEEKPEPEPEQKPETGSCAGLKDYGCTDYYKDKCTSTDDSYKRLADYKCEKTCCEMRASASTKSVSSPETGSCAGLKDSRYGCTDYYKDKCTSTDDFWKGRADYNCEKTCCEMRASASTKSVSSKADPCAGKKDHTSRPGDCATTFKFLCSKTDPEGMETAEILCAKTCCELSK